MLKLSHLLLVFPPPGVFFVLDERRDMVFNPRERSECACAYFYSDPLFERKKLFAYYCAVQARGGRRNARVASCSSNRPRRKKESDRITDPLFQRKLLLRGKSEASDVSILSTFLCAKTLSLSLSFCHHELLLAKRLLGVVLCVVGWWSLPSRKRCRCEYYVQHEFEDERKIADFGKEMLYPWGKTHRRPR